MKVFLRTEHNYDRDAASAESGLVCRPTSRTKQSFKDECDINTIVRRFGVTGQLPQGVRAPTYGDFVDVHDFRSAMDAVVLARESFDSMPSAVRARFSNNPALFVDFCSNSENLPELRKMGLAPPAPPPATPVASPVSGAPVGPSGPVPEPSVSSGQSGA